MNISLTKHFEAFVEQQVATGRYNNSSEVIRAALRLLEDEVERHGMLKARIRRGLDDLDEGRVTTANGKPELKAFMDDVKTRGRQKLKERHSE